MSYISVSEASKLYSKSEKTIRRIYENKKLSRSQGYRNKKGVWKLSTNYLDTLYKGDRVETPPVKEAESSQASSQSDSTLELLRTTIETLKDQLAVKDEQLQRLDTKLDQQQKLTLGLQNQVETLNKNLLLTSPPSKPSNQPGSVKVSTPMKKPVKGAQNAPKNKSKAIDITEKPKKKHWWSLGGKN